MDDVELVYEILWTSPNYPSAKVFPLSTAPLKSSNYIYSFNINENYVMIGPAYDVYVNGTPTL